MGKGKEDLAMNPNGGRSGGWTRKRSISELLREPQALVRDQEQGEQKRQLRRDMWDFPGIVTKPKVPPPPPPSKQGPKETVKPKKKSKKRGRKMQRY